MNHMLNPKEAELATMEVTQAPSMIDEPPMPDRHHLRIVEALLFAAPEPVDEQSLAKALPAGIDVAGRLKTSNALLASCSILTSIETAMAFGFVIVSGRVCGLEGRRTPKSSDRGGCARSVI